MVSAVPTTESRETARLISAEKVEGTPVENPSGESLGHINDIMIDKISGHVGYAVLKYGSFTGRFRAIGSPIPFELESKRGRR